jgi:hypothetical protein
MTTLTKEQVLALINLRDAFDFASEVDVLDKLGRFLKSVDSVNDTKNAIYELLLDYKH